MRSLAVATAALVMVAGCGGDSGEGRLSKDRWIEQADEICHQEKDEQDELEVPDADPFAAELDPAQLTKIAEYLEASLVIQNRATGRLDGLGLPDDDAGDIEDVLDHRKDGKASVGAAIESARAGDTEQFQLNYRRAVTDYGKASQAAREFGLEECGQP
jgi:hypothetical protein